MAADVLTSASTMFVAKDALGGGGGRVDDVTDDGGRLARISALQSSTPATAQRRLLVTTHHVRAAAGLLRADLRPDRPNHRLETRTLAPLSTSHANTHDSGHLCVRCLNVVTRLKQTNQSINQSINQKNFIVA